MAQLKSTTVTGDLTVTDNINTNSITTFNLVTTATNGTRIAQVTTSPYQGNLWNFDMNKSATSFSTGDTIMIQTLTGGSYGVFLSLDNGATYRPISLTGTTRITNSHFLPGVMLILTYDSTGSVASMRGTVDANGILSTTTGDNTVSGGCWRVVNSYDSGNTNTIGYYVRNSNSQYYPSSTLYRYQILLSSTDETKLIPACTTDNSDATNKSTIYSDNFNPFGPIYYTSKSSGNTATNALIPIDQLWLSYVLNLRYSFNTGTTLTAHKDVYLVAQMTSPTTAKLRNPTATAANASAQATGANAGPITQKLPTSEDGYIYIRLGRAYSTYQINLTLDHQIYYYKNGAVRPYDKTWGYTAPIETHSPALGIELNESAWTYDNTRQAYTRTIVSTEAIAKPDDYVLIGQCHTNGIPTDKTIYQALSKAQLSCYNFQYDSSNNQTTYYLIAYGSLPTTSTIVYAEIIIIHNTNKFIDLN